MISKDSIYKCLWKCRDLEIQMLWTRLTLLGATMALTYTGYGVLLMKFVEAKTMHWATCNLLAILASCVGMVFSCLWIATAKGSKRWYEQYEAALRYFQESNEKSFERFDNGGLCLSYLDFEKSELKALRQPSDPSLMTSCGGPYSVSKIPIVFGQLSLLGWGVVAWLHLAALLFGKAMVKMLFEELGFQLGAFMVMGTMLTASIVCSRIRSSFK